MNLFVAPFIKLILGIGSIIAGGLLINARFWKKDKPGIKIQDIDDIEDEHLRDLVKLQSEQDPDIN